MEMVLISFSTKSIPVTCDIPGPGTRRHVRKICDKVINGKLICFYPNTHNYFESELNLSIIFSKVTSMTRRAGKVYYGSLIKEIGRKFHQNRTRSRI